MSGTLLANLDNAAIYQLDDDSFTYVGQGNIDGDGSPRCYGPNDSGLDFTQNAKNENGLWCGVVTDTGRPTGNPIIQGPNDPYPGLYVSTSSLENRQLNPDGTYVFPRTSPGRYVDSEKVPAVVCPAILAERCAGILLGCVCLITDLRTGLVIPTVAYDIGNNENIGEMSIKTATMFSLPPSPRDGGINLRVFQYRFFPGKSAPGFQLQPL